MKADSKDLNKTKSCSKFHFYVMRQVKSGCPFNITLSKSFFKIIVVVVRYQILQYINHFKSKKEL